MKKLLCVFLVLAMACGVFGPAAALAAGENNAVLEITPPELIAMTESAANNDPIATAPPIKDVDIVAIEALPAPISTAPPSEDEDAAVIEALPAPISALPAEEDFAAFEPITDIVFLSFSEDGASAKLIGGADGVYARAALVLDSNGKSGLYITQVTINNDGTIVIPVFNVPGLKVSSVNISLVPTLADIQSATPDVILTATKML